jgi:hypothetical protein
MPSTQAIVDLLNEALRCDPAALSVLLFHRVAVNKRITDHPTIICAPRGNSSTLCPLGLLNGVAGLDGDIIEAQYDNDKLVGFRLRPMPEIPEESLGELTLPQLGNVLGQYARGKVAVGSSVIVVNDRLSETKKAWLDCWLAMFRANTRFGIVDSVDGRLAYVKFGDQEPQPIDIQFLWVKLHEDADVPTEQSEAQDQSTEG